MKPFARPPRPSPAPDTPARKLIGALIGLCLVLGPFAAWRRHEAAVQAASPLPDDVGRDACAIWFVGSSSMRNWARLPEDMAPWTTHNRGIGGATLPELTGRFGNGAAEYPPQGIVFYAGENDLAFGVPAATVAREFADFMTLKRRLYGALPVLFVSVKPSPTRWDDFPGQTSYNDAVRRMAAAAPDLGYVDVVPDFLPDGRPGDFYVEDGIHLKDAGYRIWAAKVRPALRRALPARVVRRCDAMP